MHLKLSDAGLDTAIQASPDDEQTEICCRVVEGGHAGELLWLYPYAKAGNGAVCSFFARLID
ncbi:MAG TPA: hypothetical protein VHP13_10035 [Gammaproteobacteria bacterium]|nr:hypothetical protein [Gammaproteobacteria bacterium]